jgi:hypothetical protein
MKSDNGFFIGRIGGSDYDCVRHYVLNNSNINLTNFDLLYNVVTKYNGYFDKETDEFKKKENFRIYLETMLRCYKESEILMTVCLEIHKNLTSIQNNNFNKMICKKTPVSHYCWVEGVTFF